MSTTHLPTPPSQQPSTPNGPPETGPPTHALRRKSYTQHLQNERAAIKTHLDRFIATMFTVASSTTGGLSPSASSAELSTTSSAASSSEADKRWTLLLAQRTEKVRERIERGKISVQQAFPEFWDSEREAAWLRRGWRGFLEGGGGADGDGCGKGGLRVGRGEDRDDDEEEMVGLMGVKKEEGEDIGDEVGDVGVGGGGGRSQQMAGMEGSSPEVKVEMGGKGVEGGLMSGQMDEMDDQGQVQRKKLGRSRGRARLENEDVVGVPCSRGWAIQNSSAEATEELVETAETRNAEVVSGFAGSRGALFEPITIVGETDDFEPGSKRKAEDEMELPGKKIKLS